MGKTDKCGMMKAKKTFLVGMILIALLSILVFGVMTGLSVSDEGKIGIPGGGKLSPQKISIPSEAPDSEPASEKTGSSKVKSPKSIKRSKSLDIPSVQEFAVLQQLTEIDSCKSLNYIGEPHELNQSVSTTGACFSINDHNVTLDCKGFSINGTFSTGILISGKDNVTVKNCIINDFGFGILITSDADNATILNNTLGSQNQFGIYMTGNSDEANIINNTISVSSTAAIRADSLDNAHLITGNNISGSPTGMSLIASNNIINNNITIPRNLSL